MECVTTKRVIRFGIMLAVFAFGLTGCTGIHVNQGISPATFLLPGLLGEHEASEAPLVAGHSR